MCWVGCGWVVGVNVDDHPEMDQGWWFGYL